MWAYKSYNDDAPDDDEPRFPPPHEPKGEKSLFSWTSGLYNKAKKDPFGKITGMLSTRRRERTRPTRSRRSSFASSFFSARQSNNDDRLDKIIKLLELVVKDKVQTQDDQLRSSARSRTSSRGSRRSRIPDDLDDDYDDDDDNDITDDDDGEYRQSARPASSRRPRPKKSISLRDYSHGALEATTGAGVQAALQNWRAKSSDGKTPGLQDRLKTTLKAGAVAAGKMGLQQITRSSSKSRHHREHSDEESMESFEDKANPIIAQLPALEAMGKNRLDEMLKAAMKGSATRRPLKIQAPPSSAGYHEPGHSRFRKEMLHYAEESPGLDEETLLEGILPPVGRYDFDEDSSGLPDPLKRPRKKRGDAQDDKIGESYKANGKSRPLHFDPSASSSVQAFDWPDKEEISQTRSDIGQPSKGKGKMAVANDEAFARKPSKTRQTSSSQGAKSRDMGEDPDMLLQQLMRISGKDGLKDLSEDDLRHLAKVTSPESSKTRQKSSGPRSHFTDDGKDPEKLLRQLMQLSGREEQKDFAEDDLRRLSKASLGHVPSPLDARTRRGESSSRRREDISRELDIRPTSQMPEEGFGIAWPTTPSHEPSDNETLPEYESPTAEAFRLNQRVDPRPESLMQPLSTIRDCEGSPASIIDRRDEVLFQRVLATMHSCLDKSKALAKKQQEYQGERLHPSTEQVILRIVGSWFMKQLPPLERANNLFAFADDDDMFGFLEELVKMSSLLGYPVLQRNRWDSDVYEHLQQEAESLQRCFLGVASVAVVKYLRHTSSDLTRDMPRILDTCYDMLKATPNDPSQVLAIIPKIRAQSRDTRCQDERKALEADGLLDILYELATEFLAGDASVSGLPDVSSSIVATSEIPSRPRSFLDPQQRLKPTPVSTTQEVSSVRNMPKTLPTSSSFAPAEDRRGMAADFFDAPTPGPEGFPPSILKDLEYKQEDTSQAYLQKGENMSYASKEKKPEKSCTAPGNKDHLIRPRDQQMGASLLMAERPKQTKVEDNAQMPQELAQIEAEGRNSSSSSDEDYPSGLDATSILPSILRKKLEGKKRSAPKLSTTSKLGMLDTLPEEGSLQEVGETDTRKLRRTPTKTRAASTIRSPSKIRAVQSIAKRVPGSYFPPAGDLVKAAERGETSKTQLRLRPGPETRKPSVYTPVTASPLRASISVVSPEASSRTSTGEELQLQRPTATISSPTGVLFSNPFSGDNTATLNTDTASTSVAATDVSMDTAPTKVNIEPAMTSPKASLVEAIQDYADDEMVFLTPMASPTLSQDAEVLAEDTENLEGEVTDVSDTSDSASIGSNEVLTSEDIRAGVLGEHDMEDLIDRGPAPLTEAEKDLAAREPEALVPGPRGVVSSQDVRNHSVSFNDFSRAYTGAVPRVEVTPGAIQNTQGEIIPIDDEDIHLEAGETLIDGTGRVWNSKGLIEPGRDDQGQTILYEVDIAQIKRANNGVMPAMMPWDDDEWMDDEPGTPSYDPDDESVSAYTPASSMASSGMATPMGRIGRRRESDRRRTSDGEITAVDRQLEMSPGLGNSIYDEDDEPLDDMDMLEEEDRINAEEEADMIRASVNEQKKMGLI